MFKCIIYIAIHRVLGNLPRNVKLLSEANYQISKPLPNISSKVWIMWGLRRAETVTCSAYHQKKKGEGIPGEL